MGYISKLLGFAPKSVSLITTASVPGPVSSKVTPTVQRIPPDELEQTYVSDSVCFNSINKGTQMIMAAYPGAELFFQNNAQFIEFFESIGDIGEAITFNELLEAIFKYQMIYGNAYVEKVFDKRTDSKVVDLVLIDPKRMDYAKDSAKKIALDKFGKPIGYTLKFPWDIAVAGMGDEVPKEFLNKVNLDQNQIFMLPRRICHFKLYTYGDRFYGLGLVEPAHKSTLYKKNIEEAQANSIYQRGMYPVLGFVGNELHEPTPQDVESTLKELVKLKHDRFSVFPHWVKVETLEVRQSEVVNETLEYLRLNQTASLGMPVPFATGAGERTNRATLTNQQKFLEFTLNDIVNKSLSTFRKYILKPISFYNKIKEIPETKWGDIQAEERNAQATRITNYVKAGILSPEDVSEFAKKAEGLDYKEVDKSEGQKKDEKLSIKELKLELEKNKSFTDKDLEDALDYVGLKGRG